MIPFILVPVLVVVVFSMAVIAIAVRSKNATVLTWLGMAVHRLGVLLRRCASRLRRFRRGRGL